jgi:hypothetical protein
VYKALQKNTLGFLESLITVTKKPETVVEGSLFERGLLPLQGRLIFLHRKHIIRLLPADFLHDLLPAALGLSVRRVYRYRVPAHVYQI